MNENQNWWKSETIFEGQTTQKTVVNCFMFVKFVFTGTWVFQDRAGTL